MFAHFPKKFASAPSPILQFNCCHSYYKVQRVYGDGVDLTLHSWKLHSITIEHTIA